MRGNGRLLSTQHCYTVPYSVTPEGVGTVKPKSHCVRNGGTSEEVPPIAREWPAVAYSTLPRLTWLVPCDPTEVKSM